MFPNPPTDIFLPIIGSIYIQYKHINYTDISQIKYKHICYKILIKVYCVGYMLLTFGEYISVEFLLLNIFCQLLGGYRSFGGFLSRGPTVRGPTVRGPIVHFVRAD